MKLNNKTPFHRKILVFVLVILDQLTIRSDLVQFQQILCFSKIEGSIILLKAPSHYQLQEALDVDLATKARVHTCVSTCNKVIISYRTHYIDVDLATVQCVLQLMMILLKAPRSSQKIAKTKIVEKNTYMCLLKVKGYNPYTS